MHQNYIERFPPLTIPKELGETNYKKIQEVYHMKSDRTSLVETTRDEGKMD